MKKAASITLLALGVAACQADNVLQPIGVVPVSARTFGSVQNVCPAPPTGIVSWWRGDGNAVDSKGGNPGTLVNGTAFSVGKVGGTFRLDGVDDDILIGTKSNLNVGTGAGVTLEAWIFPEGMGPLGNTGSGPVVEWVNGIHLWNYTVSGGMNGLTANLVDAGGAYHVIDVVTGVTQSAWNHVAVTYDKTTGAVALYINGVVVNSLNFGSLVLKTDTDLHIGHRPPNSFNAGVPVPFNGKLDDIKISNRSLTPAQIHADYDLGVAGACNLTANAGPAATGNEGSSVSFNGSASTGQNSATFDWDFGDGSTHGTGAMPSHTYKDNGSYTVTLTMHDGTASVSATTAATISNVAPVPTLTLQTVPPIHAGQPFVLRAGFSDAGVLDGPWAYKFYRNSTLLQQGTKPAQPPPGATQPVPLTIPNPGTYTFKLEITDKDGAVGTKTLQVTVVP
ncbi:MAG: PKD domain-containing protein [Gemmatimonadaceae bacterium]